ncbi:MAG: hypothetical protein FJX52_15580, partial [Alphaproteobacteria bacterium]|nr:hypothetical protein [Alphaproteobacteria bacterium]
MTKPRVGQTAKECDLTTMTVADYLAFYERRGYAYQVGRGTRPALIVVDFSVAFTKGTDKFPGGGYDKEVAATARLLAVARGRIPIFFTTIAYEPHMRDAGLWAAKIPWINGLQTGSLEVA